MLEMLLTTVSSFSTESNFSEKPIAYYRYWDIPTTSSSIHFRPRGNDYDLISIHSIEEEFPLITTEELQAEVNSYRQVFGVESYDAFIKTAESTEVRSSLWADVEMWRILEETLAERLKEG